MAQHYASQDNSIEYRGFYIKHVQNNTCADYDLPEGTSEGWRVIGWYEGMWSIPYTGISEADAKAWVDRLFEKYDA